jgi:hypothetical protein
MPYDLIGRGKNNKMSHKLIEDRHSSITFKPFKPQDVQTAVLMEGVNCTL